MKIGVVLDQEIHSGGGFQQSLNAIRQLLRIRTAGMDVEIFTTVRENLSQVSFPGVRVQLINHGWVERAAVLLLSQASPLLSRVLTRTAMVSALERKMIKRGVDIAYFVGPSVFAYALRKLPYILTVWDLCHRDHPEFPEVSSGGQFQQREHLFRDAINGSYLTISDSPSLNQRIVHRYGTDGDRLLAMPFQPANFSSVPDIEDERTFRSRLGLPVEYLFYPAQFWPHKNHARILQALARLKAQGRMMDVVFCGGDKGNLRYLKSVVDDLGLGAQVKFLGFVDAGEMNRLYKHSKGLVMPTYFGPTNLPPMEAWVYKRPVIYSDELKGQVGDAALCVDPDSVDDLADAMERIWDDADLVRQLTNRGLDRLSELASVRAEAERVLIERLRAFGLRRSCWGKV